MNFYLLNYIQIFICKPLSLATVTRDNFLFMFRNGFKKKFVIYFSRSGN